jgi:mannonate dehydratase
MSMINKKGGFTMKLSMAYFLDKYKNKIDIARQLGVKYAVIGPANDMNTLEGTDRPWEYLPMMRRVNSFADVGLKVEVVEGAYTPMEKIKLGLPGRDEEIEVFLEFLKTISSLDIHTVCYNWMPVIGWFRTNINVETRGGARVTAFNNELLKDAPLTEAGLVTADTMWSNLEYFLKAIVPTAEELGVQLAVHPDDPPVPSLRGIARILINADAFQKMIDMVPSKINGITMCQGSFSSMGENVPELIRRFGGQKKIFFAHFRDVRGVADNFVETFHEDGQTDMFECIKCYKEINFEGCIRPDHVPTMVGEDNLNPGYSTLGKLYAIGYMRGLMEAVEKVYG